MGFLLIRFNSNEVNPEIQRQNKKQDWLHVEPGWHARKRLQMEQFATEIGMSNTTAPFNSLEEDRDRNGISELVQLTLVSGETLEGQLRKSGLLLSNRSVGEEKIRKDNHVQQFATILHQFDDSIEIEIG